MNSSLTYLKKEMRNPSIPGLIFLSIFILSISIIASISHHNFFPSSGGDLDSYIMENMDNPGAEKIVLSHLKEHPDDLETINTLIYMRIIAETSNVTVENFSEDPFIKKLKEAAGINDTYIKIRILTETGGPETALNELAKNPDNAYTNFLTGSLYLDLDNKIEAIKYFQKAEKLGLNSVQNKKYILETLFSLNWKGDLIMVLEKEDYRKLCDTSCMLKYMILSGNYPGIVQYTILSEFGNYSPIIVLTSLLVGAGWYFMLLHMGGYNGWGKLSLFLSAAAVISGMLSAHITVIAVVLEEEILGFNGYNYDIMGELLYSILGIGLREELLKLICFIPLIPFIISQKESRVSLTFASLVGLGFAIEENIGYYSMGGESVTARFLTANFFHMALTGYAGYYLVEAIRKKGEHIGIFFTEFVKMIALHGLYDFFLISDHMSDLGFLSMTIFIWLTGEYLKIFSGDGKSRAVSLPFLFTAVLSLTIGAGYFLSVSMYGPAGAVFPILNGILGDAIITIMFFRYFLEFGYLHS